MKDQSPFPPSSTDQDRFIDAALREDARLGATGRDDELVQAILTATVRRPSVAGVAPLPRRGDTRLWMIGVASAAAIIAALATLLAVLPFRPAERGVQEIRFVVQYLPEPSPENTPEQVKRTGTLSPSPLTGRIEFSTPGLELPDTVSGIGDAGELPLFLPPAFATVPGAAFREDRLRLIADETVEEKNKRIYTGNVEVIHDNFRIFSERVEISATDRTNPEGGVRLVAFNATLKQTNPMRTSQASQIDYEPSTDRFSLVGVNSFESIEGRLDAFHPADQLILTRDSFSIQHSQPVIKYVNPLPLQRINE